MNSDGNGWLKPGGCRATWFCVMAAGFVSFVHAARGQYDPDWSRNLRVGLLVGMNAKVDFSLSGNFGISGRNPGPTGVSGADHFFDDGYVRVDQTGDALGLTGYWGYDSPSQYNSATHTLNFHSVSGFSEAGGSSGNDDSPYVGVDFAYGGTVGHWGYLRAGWDFGFGFLPLNVAEQRTAPATVTRSAYSFNTGGIIVPEAPYNGGPSGFGEPTIQDIASPAGGSDTLPGTVSGTQKLEVMLYTFRLGPSVFVDVTPKWGVAAGIGPAVGLVSGDYKFNETISLADGSSAQNQGENGATRFVYGGYVNATVMYHAVKGGDVYLGVQYMPMSSSNFGGGGREAKLNLSGQLYFSLGLDWPF